jgi:hypothetical protein
MRPFDIFVSANVISHRYFYRVDVTIDVYFWEFGNGVLDIFSSFVIFLYVLKLIVMQGLKIC